MNNETQRLMEALMLIYGRDLQEHIENFDGEDR